MAVTGSSAEEERAGRSGPSGGQSEAPGGAAALRSAWNPGASNRSGPRGRACSGAVAPVKHRSRQRVFKRPIHWGEKLPLRTPNSRIGAARNHVIAKRSPVARATSHFIRLGIPPSRISSNQGIRALFHWRAESASHRHSRSCRKGPAYQWMWPVQSPDSRRGE